MTETTVPKYSKTSEICKLRLTQRLRDRSRRGTSGIYSHLCELQSNVVVIVRQTISARGTCHGNSPKFSGGKLSRRIGFAGGNAPKSEQNGRSVGNCVREIYRGALFAKICKMTACNVNNSGARRLRTSLKQIGRWKFTKQQKRK